MTIPMVPWVVAEMAAVLGEEGDAFNLYLERFRELLGRRFDDLRWGAAHGDMATAARSARLLRAASARLGADCLATLSAKAESLAMRGALGADGGILTELGAEVERVRKDLGAWARGGGEHADQGKAGGL